MEMRGLMGGFYKISEWIMRLSVTNVLWLLTGLPFWFVIFFFLLATENVNMLQTNIIMMAIIAPFTFFPATSAMFSLARKWVLGDTDVPLLKTFFRSYKENFKQAMVGGIFYALLFAILIIDYYVYLSQISGFQLIAYLFIALTFLLLLSLLHFFCLLAHFQMKTLQLLKNALILTIGRPIRSLMMAIGVVAVLYLAAQPKLSFLIPFFFGSMIAVYTYYNFNLVIQKMMLMKEAAELEAATKQEEAEKKQES